MGLRRRLLLSFLLLFAAVFVATLVLSTVLVSGAVEHRLQAQTENLARLFRENPEWGQGKLTYVERAYGALSAAVEPAGRVPTGPATFRAPTLPGSELVLVFSPEAIAAEKWKAVRPFAVVAVVGLGLVLVLGFVTSQTIARPIEELARQARALPSGDVRPVGGGAELDHLVEALNRMLAEVRRSERLGVMGQMAAGVAHEIRNPLSSMKMTVQMLRESAQKDRESFDLILREMERLELITAELAGASQPLRKEPAKLESIADEVLELMGRRLEHLGVRVEKRYAAAPPVSVDVARFKRCVMNLVLNGAQAMPAGGPLRVEVGTRNGAVRLAVTDEGTGVPEGLGEKIFDPFVTTKQDGVGLGLALTKRIVEDHGGKIGFDRAPKGTTFWIEMPNG
jgi:signal transduction histidine kinase